MYAKHVPFTRNSNKGPQPAGKPSKKVTAKTVSEPAKIEETIDLITEPVEAVEEVVEPVEDPADGVN